MAISEGQSLAYFESERRLPLNGKKFLECLMMGLIHIILRTRLKDPLDWAWATLNANARYKFRHNKFTNRNALWFVNSGGPDLDSSGGST